ncbi:hypothetical protein AVEN_167314-1 [Araneus ventricosus]|uniref:Pre-C2HC domain-containing protein n=1 Tax=Araneus ventricosus TaxID=182803 RepID=A0A4Y2DBQ4_ARAVE|nr:hypothetical protein AVEN_167314-1 [Araneus ventricosus]
MKSSNYYKLKKKQDFILYEPIAERPIKAILKGIHASTLQEFFKQELEALNFEVTRIIQFKNFKEQSLHPVFQVDIKRSPQASPTYAISKLLLNPHAEEALLQFATNAQNSTIQQRIVITTLDVSNAGRTTPPETATFKKNSQIPSE